MTARSPLAVLVLALLAALLVVSLTLPSSDPRSAAPTGQPGQNGPSGSTGPASAPDSSSATPKPSGPAGSPTGSAPESAGGSSGTPDPDSTTGGGSTGSATPDPSGGGSTGSGQTPDQVSDPITVRTAAATDRAVTGSFGKRGGTLTASAADGTTYRLDLPGDALATRVPITMTPLASLDGADLEQLLGAVALEPAGLVLQRPATLVVLPSGAAAAPDRTVGFAAAPDGSDFHLRGLGAAPTPTLPVFELGTVGAAAMTAPQQDVVRSSPPASLAARFEGQLAPLLLENRVAELAGDTSTDPEPALQRVLAGYLDAGVQPALTGGLPTLADGMTAVAQGRALLERYAAYGVRDETRRDELRDALTTRLVELVDRAAQNCDDANARRLQYLLAFDRQYRRLTGDQADPAVLERTASCARFRVDLTTLVRDSWAYSSPGEVHRLAGRWKLRAATTITGDGAWSAPLRAVGYDYDKSVRRVCPGSTDRVSRWQDAALGQQPAGRVQGRLVVDRNLYLGGITDGQAGPRPRVEARIVSAPEQRVRAATYGSCAQASPDRYSDTEDQFVERYDELFDAAPSATTFRTLLRRTGTGAGPLASTTAETRTVDDGIDRTTTGEVTLRLRHLPRSGAGS